MPNTKMIPNIRTNQPVHLTRNGRGTPAIVELDELGRLKAAIKLLARLEEGEQSAREKGWLAADEIEAAL